MMNRDVSFQRIEILEIKPWKFVGIINRGNVSLMNPRIIGLEQLDFEKCTL